MIRLVVSDLDGTLCDEAHGLDIQTAKYIQKLQTSNIIFILATGRDYSIVEPLFQNFDFHCPVIALNGSVIYDEQGHKVKEHVLEKKLAKKISEIIKDEYFATWYTSKGNYCTYPKRYKQMIHDVIKDSIRDRFLQEHGYVQFNEALTMEDILQEDCVYKIDVFYSKDDIRQTLQELNEIEVSSSSSRITEITQRGIHKGSAVWNYCEEHHYQKNEVLAFGDHENDLEMLKAFPYGHIMRNAKVELLEQVNYIAPANTQHGVIKVIENFTNIKIEEDIK